MKSKWTYMLLGAMAALVLAGGAFALTPMAAAADPPAAPGPGYGYGRGMLAMHENMTPIHDKVHAAVAAKLGMTSTDLDAAIAGGKSVATLAAEKQISLTDLQQTATDAHNAALDELVAAGTIDAAFAEQMKSHQAQMQANCLAGGYGTGGGFGPQGRGAGWHGMGPGHMGRGGRGFGPGAGWGNPPSQ